MGTGRGLRSREKPALRAGKRGRGRARAFCEDRASTRETRPSTARERPRNEQRIFPRARPRENRARTPGRARNRARILCTTGEKRARTARTREAKVRVHFPRGDPRARPITRENRARAAREPREPRRARAHHARERARTARGWRAPKSLVNRARGNPARTARGPARTLCSRARTEREAREAQTRFAHLPAPSSGLGEGRQGGLHGMLGMLAGRQAGMLAGWQAGMLSRRGGRLEC
jgi:hypothetical protein